MRRRLPASVLKTIALITMFIDHLGMTVVMEYEQIYLHILSLTIRSVYLKSTALHSDLPLTVLMWQRYQRTEPLPPRAKERQLFTYRTSAASGVRQK